DFRRRHNREAGRRPYVPVELLEFVRDHDGPAGHQQSCAAGSETGQLVHGFQHHPEILLNRQPLAAHVTRPLPPGLIRQRGLPPNRDGGMAVTVRRKFVWGGVPAALAVLAAYCGGGGGGMAPSSPPGPGGSGAPSSATITLTNNVASPRTVTVVQGGQVTFVNNDSRAHQMFP